MPSCPRRVVHAAEVLMLSRRRRCLRRRKRDKVLPDIAKQLPDASHLLKEKI